MSLIRFQLDESRYRTSSGVIGRKRDCRKSGGKGQRTDGEANLR
jgi:hypothetical protein